MANYCTAKIGRRPDPGRILEILEEINIERFAGFFEIAETDDVWAFAATAGTEPFQVWLSQEDSTGRTLEWRHSDKVFLDEWTVLFFAERLARTLKSNVRIRDEGANGTKPANFDLRYPDPMMWIRAVCRMSPTTALVLEEAMSGLKPEASPLFTTPSAHDRAAARKRLAERRAGETRPAGNR